MTDLEKELLELLKNDMKHLTIAVNDIKKWVWIVVGVGVGSGIIQLSTLLGA